jgi:dihydrodipicolinate synthase/N-acetylneuraminate lyase
MTLAVRPQLSTETVLTALDGVTAIPVVPYRGGQIDYDAHAKNVRYLMRSNSLDANRPRVISIAGTSPVHHMGMDEQVKVVDVTTRAMGSDGVYMAGIVPNPLNDARKLIGDLESLQRPPDCYLIMPLSGVYDPTGIYKEYMALGEEVGDRFGARLIYYFKQSKELDAVVKLFRDSDEWIGVKVGTGIEDVEPLLRGVDDNGLVIWGIGDRSTASARLGSKGHTSGIAVAYAKASDAINNAQRAGDFAEAARVEKAISGLEDIRFRNNRVHNYSAVVEAMHLSGFSDIDGGEGAPFNPRVPAEVATEVAKAIEGLAAYH